ncbi:elongator complex protein 6 [Trichogramma pretiosum]|uniref:elongator complex protein 6 n=1 Tax=Trichogramma pretiosum TaxID=7493 RepID=UPI0006C9D98B|nr:elongator complex protein 6 [Trichogramma pretiosum]
MEEIREAIGINKATTSGSLIFIEEHHQSDANFVLQAIIAHCKEKNHMLNLVLFHNTFGHFHNVGMKLGYNLKKDLNNTVNVIEPLKVISKNIHLQNSDNIKENLEFDITNKSTHLVNQLVQIIKDECISKAKEMSEQKVYLIIDDLSHLFDVGLNVQDIWYFIRCIRSFINDEPLLTLCVTSHVFDSSLEFCETNIIANVLKHSADLVIVVRPLETGQSREISGKLAVYWKSESERLRFKWSEEMTYLYKLHDREVKLFAPGSSRIM